MTYCLGILVDDGLLMMADTRTNGGIDNVSSYRKLHCLDDSVDRQIWLASSGSLSASQSVVARLARRPEGGETSSSIRDAASMYEVADLVGAAVRKANKALVDALGPDKVKGGACFLLGGRIGAHPPQLFLVYAEGNFIECMHDVPYLQTGETKYGRPILDRVMHRATPLAAAVKIAFLSFDSAMRSNLSVARPLDMVVIPAPAQGSALSRRIEYDDPYFDDLTRRWSSTLVEAAELMPDPAFMTGTETPRPLSLVG